MASTDSRPSFRTHNSQASLSQASLSPNPHSLPTPSIVAPSTAPSDAALLRNTDSRASDLTTRRPSATSSFNNTQRDRTINLIFDNVSKLKAKIPVTWHDDRRPSHSSTSTSSTEDGPATPDDGSLAYAGASAKSAPLWNFSSPKYDDEAQIAVGWEWVVRLSHSKEAPSSSLIETIASSSADDEANAAAALAQFAIRRHPSNHSYEILTLSSTGQVLCSRPIRQKNSVLSMKNPNRLSFDAPVRVGNPSAAQQLQENASTENPNALVAIDTEWVWKGSYNQGMRLIQYTTNPTSTKTKSNGRGLGLFGGKSHGGAKEDFDDSKIVLAEYVRYSTRPALHIYSTLPVEHIPLVLASLYPSFDLHRHDFASRFNMPADNEPVDPPSRYDVAFMQLGEREKKAAAENGLQEDVPTLQRVQEDNQSVAPPYAEDNREGPQAVTSAA